MEEKENEVVVEETTNNEFKAINSKEELDEYLNQAREQWKKENEKTIANIRQRERARYDKELQLAKASDEERAKIIEENTKKEREDEFNSMKEELEALRKDKRDSEIKLKLTENKLPSRYLNDIRLVNSTDVDKTIKELVKEYDIEKASILKTNIKDTSPQVSTTNTKEKSNIDDLWQYTRMSKIKNN